MYRATGLRGTGTGPVKTSGAIVKTPSGGSKTQSSGNGWVAALNTVAQTYAQVQTARIAAQSPYYGAQSPLMPYGANQVAPNVGYQYYAPSLPQWALPAGIVAGGLALVLVMRNRKKA
jgi:hypothetical protein